MPEQPEHPVAPAPPMPLEVFRQRRDRLVQRLSGGVAILPSAPELLISRDTEVRYRPATDLYYFTGLEEPGAVAVISAVEGSPTLTLFVRPRDTAREAWVGPRLGVEGAAQATGADAVYPIGELEARLPELVAGAAALHYPIGLDPSLDGTALRLVTDARRGRTRSGKGPASLHDLDEVVGPLRRVKMEEELQRLKSAARIGAAGHLAAIRAVRPGVGEWAVEAALEAAFRRHGAGGPAFPSIVAAGANATTLHYTANASWIASEDLVLVDAGAEWGMYCSDLTRTVPASGRFSATQRAVYDVVLAAERAAIAEARPGSSVVAMHDAAVRVLAAGLIDLGLVRGKDVDELVGEGGYRRYYMHQTSHWLGLDVHDVGGYREGGEPVPLAPGMVLTVEPGLYLPVHDEELPEAFRGIGVRIEDTVAITSWGSEILTSEVPVEAEELEGMVGRCG